MAKIKNHQKKVQLTIGVLVILGLFIGTQFFMGDPVMDATLPETEAEDKEKEEMDIPVQWKEVETKEEIYEHFESFIPGLKTAAERGLFQDINQTVTIQEHGGEVYLDKIWFSSQGIFLIYSLGLEDIANLPSNHHNVGMNGISIETMDGELFPHSPTMHSTIPEKAVYEGDVYLLASGSPILDEEGRPVEKMNETVSAYFNVTLPDGSYRTEETTLGLEYDLKDNLLASFPIEQTLELEDGDIYMKEVNLDVMSTELQIQVEEEQNHPVQVEGQLKTEDQAHPFHIYFDQPRAEQQNKEPAIYSAYTSPFSDIPNDIELSFLKSSTISDQSYSFELDVSDYEEWRNDEDTSYQLTKIERADEKVITEIFDTKVLIDRLEYNHKGAELTIRYDHSAEEDSGSYLSLEAPSFLHKGSEPWLDTNITIENENDESPLSQANIHRMEQNSFTLILPSSFFEESEQLNITVEDLLHTREISEKLTVNTAE
ncbi:hypothetical protein [Thalassobacillus devorans]|uniref:hypothetical protein n=1 Tax=Thalassobacillus devorans TaxID=279813 RepID=UPI000A1CE8D6|nr:hypothetical protein [Thalassobacillus devorans]